MNSVEHTWPSGGDGGGFRLDVNGLRAWAVMLVVLYHFKILGVKAGFVGVDVFFVISGYLMTGIIVRGLATQGSHFSILGFYFARARRIVPAQLTLIAVLLIAGWWMLSPPEFEKLGRHAASAAAFVSNVVFWREAGYFDTGSFEKWLLHTWSLSVEWQFYLVLPLALAAMWKFSPGRRNLTFLMLAGLFVSFVASVVLSPISPVASFYLLPTRAWEMLAGGLVFLRASPPLGERSRRVLEIIGFGLIVLAAFAFDPTSEWPGWRAVVPVSGTILVLLASRSDSVLTGNRFAQWLGSISYSVYLWHWPIVVFLIYLDRFGQPEAVATGLIASLVLGHMSWALVEQSTRRAASRIGLARGLAGFLVITLAVVAVGSAVSLREGFPGRLDPSAEQAFNEAKNGEPIDPNCRVAPPKRVPECSYGEGALAAIVLGDSHARHLLKAVVNAVGSGNGQVLDWTYAGCPTLLSAMRRDENFPGGHTYCRDFIRYALEQSGRLAQAPLIILNRASIYPFGANEYGRELEYGRPLIFYANPEDRATEELIAQFRLDYVETVCRFAAQRPTFLLRPIPEMRRNVPRAMGVARMLGLDPHVSISLEEYRTRQDLVLQAQDEAMRRCGVRIIDPIPVLCRNGRCWGDADGLPIYVDDSHLSDRGAMLLRPLLHDAISRASQTGNEVLPR